MKYVAVNVVITITAIAIGFIIEIAVGKIFKLGNDIEENGVIDDPSKKEHEIGVICIFLLSLILF